MPLLRARREKRERGEVLDEIVIEESREETEGEKEDEAVTEIFEEGKSYGSEETEYVLTVERRTAKRIYCHLNNEGSSYYRARIYAEHGSEILALLLPNGDEVKFYASNAVREEAEELRACSSSTERRQRLEELRNEDQRRISRKLGLGEYEERAVLKKLKPLREKTVEEVKEEYESALRDLKLKEIEIMYEAIRTVYEKEKRKMEERREEWLGLVEAQKGSKKYSIGVKRLKERAAREYKEARESSLRSYQAYKVCEGRLKEQREEVNRLELELEKLSCDELSA